MRKVISLADGIYENRSPTSSSFGILTLHTYNLHFENCYNNSLHLTFIKEVPLEEAMVFEVVALGGEAIDLFSMAEGEEQVCLMS